MPMAPMITTTRPSCRMVPSVRHCLAVVSCLSTAVPRSGSPPWLPARGARRRACSARPTGTEACHHGVWGLGVRSDDLGVLERGDLVPRIAEQLGEDLLGVLAELGGGAADA